MAKFPPAGNTISSSIPGPSTVKESQDSVFDQLMMGARSVAGKQMAETKDVRMISNADLDVLSTLELRQIRAVT